MQSEPRFYDVIVVGAGIEGSSTAYSLAKNGKRTLLLEQYALPHSNGSSHGKSRAAERAFGNRDIYVHMTNESFKLIEELEEECGEQLFINCGWLTFGEKGDALVSQTEQSLKRYKFPYNKFDAEEQRKMYPNLSLPNNFECLLDRSGGVLKADKMLKVYQDQFVHYGGVLLDGEQMVDLHLGSTVSVDTNNGVYKSRAVVLTLGPWAARFLPKIGINVPLQPVKINVYYWKERNGHALTTETFPAFFTKCDGGNTTVGGMPSIKYPGLLKICLSPGTCIDPDSKDEVDYKGMLEKMKRFTTTHFPSLEEEPRNMETCYYTNTQDGDYILDVHPDWKNVVIGAGFSGHGFKLSPVIGKILGQLATEQTPFCDLSSFQINRF
ncbi:peroxisomal sarcosine oxidase-like [Mercenaria mercenaria]|uniref:peroxisomal sarcosine oxidase-like n=1 Tax=Mercenaria mercenaria TaxID=6596 RepID=UPI00234EE075|nr:peroxisomal sarcosine oxidase-like [Mercenaria mercenaria]